MDQNALGTRNVHDLTVISEWLHCVAVGTGDPQRTTSRSSRHEVSTGCLSQASPRPYQGLPDVDYPFHDRTIVVTNCGRICLGKRKINFGTVFTGQAVGIKEVHDDIWLVSLMDYDLGYFDLETRVLEPLENPFGPKVLPM